MIKRRFLLLMVFMLSSIPVLPMVYDNRILPLVQKPFISIPDCDSHFHLDAVFMTGKTAFGPDVMRPEVSIPEIFGTFDQGDLGRAMTAAGLTSPMPPEWVTGRFPWGMFSKIQAEGISFYGQFTLADRWSIGFSAMALWLVSRLDFALTQPTNPPLPTEEDRLDLDTLRRVMFDELGITSGYAKQSGMGDLDLYVRYGSWADYIYKMRRIEAGLRFGALFPTGVRRNPDNPSSVPFGGDGHYGIYAQGDADFEFKEDWTFGLWFRVIKRFSRDQIMRLQVLNEQLLFGVERACVNVDPGVTFVGLPYVYFENIREGLGLGLQYTVISHLADSFAQFVSGDRIDLDYTVEQNPTGEGNTTKSTPLHELSSWSSEYVTLNIFYDFGKMKDERNFSPIVSVTWDIPVSALVAEKSAKLYNISLGVEFTF